MQLERDFANKLVTNRETIRREGSINPKAKLSKPMRGKYLHNVD